MSYKELIIEGARQNNLKNINLKLPHNKVITITGVSGSGKSSLAFDTVFAEGQWRFIESLSTYARLFLEKLDRPDVDAIHNIRPAIALEQRNPVRGSRSTVGTLTELYDLLRLLYSKISKPFCPLCGEEIKIWDPSHVISELIEKYRGEKAIIVFETRDQIDELKKRGFYRAWIDNEVVDFSSLVTNQPLMDIVLDRLVIKDEPRLSDSIEMAWKEGEGKMKVIIVGTSQTPQFKVCVFSSDNTCEKCNIELPKPYPLLFSFNHPVGACEYCKGFGNILKYDEDLILPDKSLSLSKGAIDPWNKPAYRWWRKQLIKNADKEGIDTNMPYYELTENQKALLFEGCSSFYGINDFFNEMESRRYKLHIRVFISRYRRPVTCSQCSGKRLKKESLAYKLSGLDIAELCRIPLSEIIKFFENMDISLFQRDMTKELLRQIDFKLGFLKRVGLNYLSLSRDGRTLSGGEYQRVNLSNQLASFLTGTLYVLDEPTVGLHAKDTKVIADIMSELSKLGNTVIVVEHDRGIIESADWIVEMGPGGGHKGGEIVFSGNKDEFLQTDTLTARYLNRINKIEAPFERRRSSDKKLSLYGASGNNLKYVDFEIPLQTMITVTGVSGSGKSSLVVETLYRALAREYKSEHVFPLPYKKISGSQYLQGVKLIDQTPIGRSPRSNPVTYLKIFDVIRKLFSEQSEAKAYGYNPGFFSFNVSGGRCETCKGAGYQRMEMYFFEDLYIKCEVCGGKRYRQEALRVTCRGKNINEILNTTVDEAIDLFPDITKIKNKLLLMKEIGLGYLRLGQPATTLSGGEAQRLKICDEMINTPSSVFNKERRKEIKKGFLYILDEPTVGLHFSDVKALLDILQRLVASGNTVLIIEHNLDVIKASDWIIDLGPEGGDSGGKIVFEGTPEDIIKSKDSYTGKYLRNYFIESLVGNRYN
ncbi:MAG: excinuclease ABC subunit A [Nitrospirae bacterium RBG_13_39_12]|nr:MAG: excinuclease ABC subunit A [Nitrospirae bacterium RBG_13_39_12]